jgi:DNA-binding response OmpR family regulator
VRILLVEDDGKMATLLRKGLEEERHSVEVARTGPDGLLLSRTYPFDVIILDVMLPGLNGFDVARRLRGANGRTPILMLTARDAVGDVIKGLDAGADDYLTKPFDFNELLARLRAVSRRGPIERRPTLSVADLELDPATHRASRAGRQISLTKTEHLLLEVLMRQAGRVLSRGAIIEAVWGFGATIENNTLDAFVRLLRAKVDSGHKSKLIHTIRGVGYVLQKDPPS